MLFVVFVSFYLYTDHAPAWLWCLAGVAFVFDQAEERGFLGILRRFRA